MDALKKRVALYSIGHSNHSISHFLSLLERHGIQAVADVRSSPYSRHYPQFSKEAIERSLGEHNIDYVFLGSELGARRNEQECYSDGKVDYDQVTKTEAFQRGIARLLKGASTMRVAMVCAEKDPLTCHRTILIGRYVKNMVTDVLHILHDGEIETQSQAEQRLLSECDMDEGELFTTREQRILEAYHKRACRIAYEEEATHA